jgi:hypothetical protein
MVFVVLVDGFGGVVRLCNLGVEGVAVEVAAFRLLVKLLLDGLPILVVFELSVVLFCGEAVGEGRGLPIFG